MTTQEAMLIVLPFAKLFYNEVMAGNVKVDMPEGYGKKIQEAIGFLEDDLLQFFGFTSFAALQEKMGKYCK